MNSLQNMVRIKVYSAKPNRVFYLYHDRTLLLFFRPMRNKDTSALREIFQYSSLAEKPLDQWKIATHWRAFQIQDKSRHCDPHLYQTKFNGLLPLTIPGALGVIPFQGSASFPLSLPTTENRFRSIFQSNCSFKRCQWCKSREYSILED